MYQVIKMYGDWEPWWFLDDWRNDIKEELSFIDFDEALQYYAEEWTVLKATYPSFQSKKNLLAAFWNKEDQRWCEECDEFLQQYHSLLLLKDGEQLAIDQEIASFEAQNDKAIRASSCVMKLKRN